MQTNRKLGEFSRNKFVNLIRYLIKTTILIVTLYTSVVKLPLTLHYLIVSNVRLFTKK
jgi:hypothetical protein